MLKRVVLASEPVPRLCEEKRTTLVRSRQSARYRAPWRPDARVSASE